MNLEMSTISRMLEVRLKSDEDITQELRLIEFESKKGPLPVHSRNIVGLFKIFL